MCEKRECVSACIVEEEVVAAVVVVEVVVVDAVEVVVGVRVVLQLTFFYLWQSTL
jgi:hypothetical protein